MGEVGQYLFLICKNRAEEGRAEVSLSVCTHVFRKSNFISVWAATVSRQSSVCFPEMNKAIQKVCGGCKQFLTLLDSRV